MRLPGSSPPLRRKPNITRHCASVRQQSRQDAVRSRGDAPVPDRLELPPSLQAERERRKAVKERKEANVKKSLKGQKITNNATLKRMMKSKKQRKQLVQTD